MKNTVITVRRKKIELLTLLGVLHYWESGQLVCYNFL